VSRVRRRFGEQVSFALEKVEENGNACFNDAFRATALSFAMLAGQAVAQKCRLEDRAEK
jgi:hypothetical protein